MRPNNMQAVKPTVLQAIAARLPDCASLLAAAAFALIVTGCGFEMRGAAQLPFKTIWLGASEKSPLGVELRRQIRAGTTTQLAEKADGAEARLEILGETRDKEILSLNSAGRVREYNLFYRVHFHVTDSQGNTLIEPTQIELVRDISVNENTILAMEIQEEQLFRDMQIDAAQQLLRRLSAARKSG